MPVICYFRAVNRRDIVIGLVILAILAAVVYWVRRPRPSLQVPQSSPSVEEKIEEAFNLEIPEDVDKADLRDVSGGDSSGIATRKFEAGKFTHTVLADLPAPAPGTFYEGWLVKGTSFFSTGKMRIAKGGYLLEFKSSVDYSDYNKVVITLEKVDDKKPETHILEGSFQ